MGHGGAAGMSMDSMVRDMRNRFLVAATFSVPILLWSPIGRNVLGFTVAAPFGLRDDVWLLLLSLPVIFYSSWIFFDGAVAALLATGVSLAVAAAVASIAQWGAYVVASVLLALTYAMIGVILAPLFGRDAGVLVAFLVPFLDLGIAQDPCSTRPRPRGRTSCPATEASASSPTPCSRPAPSDRSVADRTSPACRRWPAVPPQHAGRQRLSTTLPLPPGGI